MVMVDMSTADARDAAERPQTLEEEMSSAIASAFLHLEAIDRQALGRCRQPLTNAQFHALVALAQNPGKSLGELAARLLCDKANASGIVDRLTAMGLATRVRDSLDGRRVVLTLTPAGKSALGEARTLRSEALSRAFATLSTEQRVALGRQFTDLVALLTAVTEQSAT